MELTQARLKEVLEYDPETGVFRWLPRPVRTEHLRTDRVFNSNFAGKIAGADNGRGYLAIEVDAVGHKAHRLAWFYVHGVWPLDQIDHINRDRKDNRIANLREADNAKNQANAMRTDRKIAPYKGLAFHKRAGNRPWQAKITTGGKRLSLGYFATAEAAYSAYCDAARKYHGEFASYD